MKEFIDERVASGEYGTVSEYVRALVRSEQIRIAKEWLDDRLMEGLQSPVADYRPGEIRELLEQIRQQRSEQRKQA